MLDVYTHHAVTCPIEGGKVRLHNQSRDAFFRCLSNAALGARLDPEGILPTEQGRRPADILFVPTPLGRQSQWALYPQIALDFAVVSPFKVGEFQVAAEKAQGLQVLMPKPNVLIMLLRSGVEPKELDLNLWFLRCWAAWRRRRFVSTNLSVRRLIVKLNNFWVILAYDSYLVFRLTSNDTYIGVANEHEYLILLRQRAVKPLVHSYWMFLE